jgi:hypothetical protein
MTSAACDMRGRIAQDGRSARNRLMPNRWQAASGKQRVAGDKRQAARASGAREAGGDERQARIGKRRATSAKRGAGRGERRGERARLSAGGHAVAGVARCGDPGVVGPSRRATRDWRRVALRESGMPTGDAGGERDLLRWSPTPVARASASRQKCRDPFFPSGFQRCRSPLAGDHAGLAAATIARKRAPTPCPLVAAKLVSGSPLSCTSASD